MYHNANRNIKSLTFVPVGCVRIKSPSDSKNGYESFLDRLSASLNLATLPFEPIRPSSPRLPHRWDHRRHRLQSEIQHRIF
ncbi:MAG: hypothetical protein U0X93_07950 [Anaerolineales bacterium]